ncbi:CLUMA_CG006831, isoform A [Clunio marinus]|uniref:CLUMA_CG006831, isoform A n=1 Tax=Clunio marinus TaxID=568069 RepID=A0A1J1HYV7_9DIPT|nr:CLUMA_CG006831, isoform A [Clunio marinus]
MSVKKEHILMLSREVCTSFLMSCLLIVEMIFHHLNLFNIAKLNVMAQINFTQCGVVRDCQ